MDEEHKIDRVACVRVIIELDDKRGWAPPSSFYGSYTTDSEFVCPEGKIAKFCKSLAIRKRGAINGKHEQDKILYKVRDRFVFNKNVSDN